MFEGALAKISWAEAQTTRLETDIASFLGMDHYEVTENFDPQTGRKDAVLHLKRDIPGDWPVRLGEILHDLRSALDHAVTDLTIAQNGHPLKGTEFPVFEDEANYSRVRSTGPDKGQPALGSGLHKIRGVSDGAKATIKWLQPFEVKKRNPGRPSALSSLHWLNIIDKHRTIHILRHFAAGGEWRLLRGIEPIAAEDGRTYYLPGLPVGEMKDGTPLGQWLAVHEPKDAVDVEFKINAVIALGESEPMVSHLRGLPIADVCRALTNGTRFILGMLSG